VPKVQGELAAKAPGLHLVPVGKGVQSSVSADHKVGDELQTPFNFNVTVTVAGAGVAFDDKIVKTMLHDAIGRKVPPRSQLTSNPTISYDPSGATADGNLTLNGHAAGSYTPVFLEGQHPLPSQGQNAVERPRVSPILAQCRRCPGHPVPLRPAMAAVFLVTDYPQDPGGRGQSDSVRILAIDPGSKRLGLALSDPSGTVALPLSVLHRRSEPEDLQELNRIVVHNGVELVLVGLPRMMDGTVDVAARNAQAFGAEVGRVTGLPVEYWDERLTTVAAERFLIEQGKRRARRRQDVDRVAATLLLQGYLDYRGNRGSGG